MGRFGLGIPPRSGQASTAGRELSPPTTRRSPPTRGAPLHRGQAACPKSPRPAAAGRARCDNSPPNSNTRNEHHRLRSDCVAGTCSESSQPTAPFRNGVFSTTSPHDHSLLPIYRVEPAHTPPNSPHSGFTVDKLGLAVKAWCSRSFDPQKSRRMGPPLVRACQRGAVWRQQKCVNEAIVPLNQKG